MDVWVGPGLTEKGESCIVVTEEREGRSRGCIREDPKEGFRKDVFRKVRRSMFGCWVLRAGVLFDVATGEKRPAAQMRGPFCGKGLWARTHVLAQRMGPRRGEGYSAKGACGFTSKRGFLGKEQERPLVGAKVADGPGSGHLS